MYLGRVSWLQEFVAEYEKGRGRERERERGRERERDAAPKSAPPERPTASKSPHHLKFPEHPQIELPDGDQRFNTRARGG
jgi:hypothetical protein